MRDNSTWRHSLGAADRFNRRHRSLDGVSRAQVACVLLRLRTSTSCGCRVRGDARAVTYLWRVRESAARLEAARLEAAPADLRFGTVWASSAHRHSVSLYNRSNETIILGRIHASCRCTAVHPTRMTLDPGEAGRAELTLDLASLPRSRDWESDFKTNLVGVIEGDRPQRANWSVQGTVRHPFHLSANAFRFVGADEVRSDVESDGRSIILTPHDELRNLDFVCDAELGSVELVETSDPRSFRLTFVPNRAFALGDFEGVIELNGEQRFTEIDLFDGQSLQRFVPRSKNPQLGPLDTQLYEHSLDLVSVVITPSEYALFLGHGLFVRPGRITNPRDGLTIPLDPTLLSETGSLEHPGRQLVILRSGGLRDKSAYYEYWVDVQRQSAVVQWALMEPKAQCAIETQYAETSHGRMPKQWTFTVHVDA